MKLWFCVHVELERLEEFEEAMRELGFIEKDMAIVDQLEFEEPLEEERPLVDEPRTM